MNDETTVVDEVEEEVLAPWEADEVEAPPKPKPRKRRTRKKPAAKEEPEPTDPIVPGNVEVALIIPIATKREYRLELFEEGDQRVFARQRALSREGWKWPVIHGFRRKAPSGLVADSFLILVASREVDVVPEED